MKFESLAIHAGRPLDPATRAVTIPIYLSTTFARDGLEVTKGYEYTRSGNPTRNALETAIATLEGAKFGAAFSSGSAATDAVIHLLKSGDHAIVSDDAYGGTFRLFNMVYAPLGVHTSFVDMTDLGAIEKALTPATRLIWIESPTNPTMKIVDMRAVAKMAKARSIITACDNTFMTPYTQRPLELGVDIVVHSTTKFLNGHTDVLGGFVATNDPKLAERIAYVQNAVGAVQSPMDSYLVLRGLKTLHLRMDRQQSNAMAVATFLESHPKVARVTYPGLKSHPQHALAASQATGFGAMLTMEVKGGLESVRKVAKSVRLFVCAESLGGLSSLLEHPASMTHASVPVASLAKVGVTEGLVRLSIGAEHYDDLIEDLRYALERA